MLTIEQLDARIADLEEELQRLRADRNSRMVISKVPPEIMIKICHNVRELQNPASLNSFLHTCRSIYSVGVSSPQLWTCLDSVWSPDWLGVSLDRAQSLPLTIFHDTTRLHKRHQELDILPYVSSACAVEIRFSPSTPSMAIWRALESSAPLMEDVTMIGSFEERFLLPANLFGTSSNIRTLNLSQANILQVRAFPALRKLTLGPGSRFRIVSFVQLVQGSPLLEDIGIDNVDCYGSLGDLTEDEIKIRLPHLWKLAIHQRSMTSLSTLLSVIPCPWISLDLYLWPFDHNEAWVTSVSGPGLSVVLLILQFWQATTGETQLPALTVTLSCSFVPSSPTDDPSFYSQALSTNHRRPSEDGSEAIRLHWRIRCTLINEDALLSRIRILEIELDGDRIGLRQRPQNINVDLLTDVEHVSISKAFTVDWLWDAHGQHDLDELEAWIRQLVAAGRPLKTITFSHCREDLGDFYDIIVEEDLVQDAYWYSDTEDEEDHEA
jgi:hypothetical protein